MAEGAMATANRACVGLTLLERQRQLSPAGEQGSLPGPLLALEVLGCSLREQRAPPPPAFVWCGLERGLPLAGVTRP